MTIPTGTTTNGDGIRDERTAAAAYIATLASDLAGLAKAQGLDTLAYILDMAKLEAENRSRGDPGSN
jgi:hypothetical protein